MKYNKILFIFFISIGSITPSISSTNAIIEFIKCVRGGTEYDPQKTKKYRYVTAAGILGTLGTIAAGKIGYNYWFAKPPMPKLIGGFYPTKTAMSQHEQIKIDQLLGTAVKCSELNAVKSLLKLHANVHTKNIFGQTPLCTAQTREIAQLLINAGADIHACDNEGNTPLMKAADKGKLDVVTLLFEKGARLSVKNKYGKTALDKAVVQKAMCTPAEYKAYEAVITYLQNTQQSLDKALVTAIQRSQLDNVTHLLNQGANPNPSTNQNIIPLFFAKTKEITKALINAGARVNEQNTHNKTALHEAGLWGHADVAAVLIENGADVTLKDLDKRTALYYAQRRVDDDKEEAYDQIIASLKDKIMPTKKRPTVTSKKIS